jgi:hypothetical protein
LNIKKLVSALAVLPMLVGVAQASTINFDNPGDTAGATVDRYAPAVFQSGVAFGGHAGTLVQGTSVSDGAANRPSSYSSSFYNTQGRAFTADPNTQKVSIQLYVSSNWTNEVVGLQRYAGFWGVGTDGSSVSAYPIIEMFRENGIDQWRGYDSSGAGAWITMGNATEGWNNLEISLLGTDQFLYTVNGGFSTLTDANGSTSIKSTILQVYNTSSGVAYEAHWDNLTTAVPEPSTWAMMIAGFGLIGGIMLRQRRRAQTAIAAV